VRVVLQGSLAHFPAAELLPLLASHAHSGTLLVLDNDKQVRIFVRAGKVDWTEASAGLGAEEAILDLFTWTSGEFAFQDEVILPNGVNALDLDPSVLIEEGVRRAAAVRDLLSAYRPEQTFCVVNPPEGSEQISLKPEEFNVIFRIGSGRMLAQVAADLGRPFSELVPVIRTLHANGLLREIEQSSFSDQTFQLKAPQWGGGAPAAASESRDRGGEGAAAPPRPAPRSRTLAGSLTVQDASASVHPLLDSEYFIGRDGSNAIVLTDVSVSGRHARIVRTPEGFFIEDLKSRNGTFVNGERVTEQHALADNDVVRFGRIVLTFNVAHETNPGEMTNPAESK